MKSSKTIYAGLIAVVMLAGVGCNSESSSGGGTTPPLSLGENGITIKARAGLVAGETYPLNGVTYTLVNETMLRAMINNRSTETSASTDTGTIRRSSHELDLSRVVTTGITNMSALFQNTDLNQNIETWDVSSVNNMSNMFQNNAAFDQPIGAWDVSSVTTMSFMFCNTDSFNQPIGSWNVSKVTTTSYMFDGARRFNQDISNWNVGNVTDVTSMFMNAVAFDQDISGWDTDQVTSSVDFDTGSGGITVPDFGDGSSGGTSAPVSEPELDMNATFATPLVLGFLAAPASHNATDVFQVTVTFDDTVTGFGDVDADVTVTGATWVLDSDGSDSRSVYTLLVTPNGTEEITLSIPDGAAQDRFNRSAYVAREVVVPYVDGTLTSSISFFDDFTTTNSIDITVSFNNPATGLSTDDFIPVGLIVNSVTPGSGFNTSYIVNISPVFFGFLNGTVLSISVKAGAVQDASGINGNTASATRSALLLVH